MKKSGKKILVYMAISIMFIILLQVNPIYVHATENTKFSGQGDGTNPNPYVITSVDQLNEIRNDLDASYILDNDLDLSMVEWSPIGTEENPFTGRFNGNGHIIRNLNIDMEKDFDNIEDITIYVGMFGYISNAIVEKIGLENINYQISFEDYDGEDSPFVNVGGIVGGIKESELSQCYLTGSINNVAGKEIYVRIGAIGCIVTDYSRICNCYTNANVYAQGYSKNTMVSEGAAWLTDSTVENCYVRGYITGKNTSGYVYAGGINASGESGSVENCIAILDGLETSGYYCYENSIGNFSTQNGNLQFAPNETYVSEKSTYINCGWDFNNIWNMNNGYASLSIFDDNAITNRKSLLKAIMEMIQRRSR